MSKRHRVFFITRHVLEKRQCVLVISVKEVICFFSWHRLHGFARFFLSSVLKTVPPSIRLTNLFSLRVVFYLFCFFWRLRLKFLAGSFGRFILSLYFCALKQTKRGLA